MSFVRLDDKTVWPWPMPQDPDSDSLEHRLRYGEPTRSELLSAASVIAAYVHLIQGTTMKEATQKLRMIKAAVRGRPSGEGGR